MSKKWLLKDWSNIRFEIFSNDLRMCAEALRVVLSVTKHIWTILTSLDSVWSYFEKFEKMIFFNFFKLISSSFACFWVDFGWHLSKNWFFQREIILPVNKICSTESWIMTRISFPYHIYAIPMIWRETVGFEQPHKMPFSEGRIATWGKNGFWRLKILFEKFF